MRYPADQKAKARAALIDAGARSLKTCGFNGIGVDGLAAAAGATSGAFYSKFANKEAEAYERKISTLAQRIASLLDGKRSDRERRAWSIVALMVGALTISRAMTDQGETRAAAIQSAHRTALSLVD